MLPSLSEWGPGKLDGTWSETECVASYRHGRGTTVHFPSNTPRR
jgi:hypothetical protein